MCFILDLVRFVCGTMRYGVIVIRALEGRSFLLLVSLCSFLRISAIFRLFFSLVSSFFVSPLQPRRVPPFDRCPPCRHNSAEARLQSRPIEREKGITTPIFMTSQLLPPLLSLFSSPSLHSTYLSALPPSSSISSVSV